MSPRLRAILVALLVTFLWSTSWVLIKIGLEDSSIPPLTFAGLRYTLAFLALLPVAFRRDHLATLRGLSRRAWLRLALLGLVFYTLTQGAQFWALAYLPATTFSLLLNFSAVVVALLGIPLLREIPGPVQWAGIAVFLAGVLLYFLPIGMVESSPVGLLIATASILANSISAIMGRHINRSGILGPALITVTTMGAGALALLAIGLIVQGLPPIPLSGWLIILWLALVNSALAFTLWNFTQRTLTATESSIINNTMLIQIAALAWIFLGETLSVRQIAALGLAALGVLLAQVRRSPAAQAEGT